MSGIASAFVRIPDNEDAWGFAKRIARLLHDSPHISTKGLLWVQHADGFSWLHIEGWENFPNSSDGELPTFRASNLETIYLVCHEGSGSHGYLHFSNDLCLRDISIGDGTLYCNFGQPEDWEFSVSTNNSHELAGDGSDTPWPKRFDANMILKAFNLPSPWSGGDLEILDINICVANPEENDMSCAITE